MQRSASMADLSLSCGEGTEGSASKSGDYRLTWNAPEGVETRLVEVHDAQADEVIYQGAQRASTVTGRPEGDYHYRVGVVEDGEVTHWSAPCDVAVRPYSLAVAFLFFGIGLLITVSTAALVIRGHRAHRRGAIG